ncbi:DUF484 family protein [Roseospirillum parvum]|uniref:DUF484 family protein n=1 Tax=Roseospirillum parvum TaxID=83401 RepID=A0A1G7V4E8_9PROT|nr:DUF484 family protein [Roseospirillum parvum]SDG54636.1 hypothetical protein SAMN05421742_101536 [Roseospirillum parvum]
MSQEADPIDGPDEAAVAHWLRSHPEALGRLLAGDPALIDALLNAPDPAPPPAQGKVVSLQPFLMSRLRREMADLKASTEDLIHTSRANLSIQGRTHEAALALLDAAELPALADTLAERLPLILELDACVLCLETGPRVLSEAVRTQVTNLPQGTVDVILGPGRDVLLREKVEGGVNLYGPAAGLVCSDALVRLRPPALDGTPMPTGLLALGSRVEGTFSPGQGVELLTFLAAVLARVTGRLISPLLRPPLPPLSDGED